MIANVNVNVRGYGHDHDPCALLSPSWSLLPRSRVWNAVVSATWLGACGSSV